MTASDDRRGDAVTHDASPLVIICGGGSLPFAVADAALRQGRTVMLAAVQGAADPQRVVRYPHEWVRIGQVGKFFAATRRIGAREVVWIGTMTRPTLRQLGLDLKGLTLLPRLIGTFRGGDNHLLSSIAALFEEHGLKLIGADKVAPEILVPRGVLAKATPSTRDEMDIAHGLKLLDATGPFDIGQAVVVADQRVLAIEAAEGTDEMLARLASLRERGRVRFPAGRGVLVKAPKPGQDRRMDLPAIGPKTIEGVALAGLAGVAVAAGSAVMAEPEQVAMAADRKGLFVLGIDPADGAE